MAATTDGVHVDRTRFVLLATAMAAGCGRQGEARDPGSGKDSLTTVDIASPEDVPLETVVEAEPVPRSGDAEPTGSDLASKLAAACRRVKQPPGPACESFSDTLESCERFGRIMHPEAAEVATECITHFSGRKDLCTFNVAAACFLKGARAAPRHGSAAKLCGPALSRCGGNRYAEADMTAANCEAAVSAVHEPLRGKMLSCISEGCGVGNCLYYLE